MQKNDNIEKWIKFLDPENLKGNLMFSSLYIATFEAFKDYVIDEVKYFFHTGFLDGVDKFDPKYSLYVKSKDKSLVKATLLWLEEMDAINENDIEIFNELIQYRNKLSHELMDLLFEGLPKELPEKFKQLIQLRIKIEKWWKLNIDIPTNLDFDTKDEIQEESIMTTTQMFNQLIFDLLSGDEKKANYYREMFIKKFNK